MKPTFKMSYNCNEEIYRDSIDITLNLEDYKVQDSYVKNLLSMVVHHRRILMKLGYTAPEINEAVYSIIESEEMIFGEENETTDSLDIQSSTKILKDNNIEDEIDFKKMIDSNPDFLKYVYDIYVDEH